MTDTALAVARQRFAAGWRPASLLSQENTKLLKTGNIYGLSLAPANLSGYEVCASRSPLCTLHCINSSGRGKFFRTQWARIFRTIWYYEDRKSFIDRLMHEIGRDPDSAYRLNVFSDIMWERQFPEIFSAFPKTQFYDYTKHFKRMFHDRPSNYHLTFSLHENNEKHALEVLQAGMNVAAVTDIRAGTLFGFPIIDGDEHDLRFLDPKPCVVGLRAKGSLRSAPTGGFVYASETT